VEVVNRCVSGSYQSRARVSPFEHIRRAVGPWHHDGRCRSPFRRLRSDMTDQDAAGDCDDATASSVAMKREGCGSGSDGYPGPGLQHVSQAREATRQRAYPLCPPKADVVGRLPLRPLSAKNRYSYLVRRPQAPRGQAYNSVQEFSERAIRNNVCIACPNYETRPTASGYAVPSSSVRNRNARMLGWQKACSRESIGGFADGASPRSADRPRPIGGEGSVR
jgi:hypothetical protein